MLKNKVLSYAFRIIAFFVISIILGLTIYTINARGLTGQKLVMPFNKTIAYVLTGSMEPTIGVNDLIVVEKTNDYEVNDIVVYQYEGKLIVHRIYSIDGDTVITLGDANGDSYDDPIHINAIQGEVVDIIPFLGLVLKILKHPITIVLILSLAITLLVLSYKKEENKEINDLKKELEKLKKELNK